MEERIQKILARTGYGSRRACEEFIVAGRVFVNGNKAELGQKADQSKDKIEIDHTAIPKAVAFKYIAYNKQRFVLCDKVLGNTRRTVFDMVPGGQELSIVGRLDFESEGLVLLTNDGELVNKLTHPRYEHEKEYRVLLASRPDAKQFEAWRRGIVLEDGHRTSPSDVKIETTLGKGVWLRIVMKEGHKRQIRETAKMLGLYVIRILRIRIGSLVLGTLKPGEYRELTESEVAGLKENKKQLTGPSRRPLHRQTESSHKPSNKQTESFHKTSTRQTDSSQKPSNRQTESFRKPLNRQIKKKSD